MKQVTVLCKDGTAEIEVNGVKGEGCRDLTLGLDQALGGSVLSDVATEEMNERSLTEDASVGVSG